jgi:integrase
LPPALATKGLPSLPHTTPHTLRRIYISIALIANNFDVKWVMKQVGHADSRMTMDVYAQLEQRIDRSHGTTSTGSSATGASNSTHSKDGP